MKSIDEDLIQHTQLINVPEEYRADLSAEYSTPIRKLGVNVSLSADERWSRTTTFINNLSNTNSNLLNELGISIDNRKKNKWEVEAGLKLGYNRSLFSLPSTSNQSYVKANMFADLNFTPVDHWHFSIKADYAHYYGKAFVNNVNVPLLQVEASYTFLNHQRGTLILTAFDLLNRNTGIERTSEYNYLLESKSNIIQRYVMLSFRYKLNKFSSKDKEVIKINGR